MCRQACEGSQGELIGRDSSLRPCISPCICLFTLSLSHLVGKYCDHSKAYIFNWIFFILAGNKDNHKILDELKIQPDPTRDCRVSCP